MAENQDNARSTEYVVLRKADTEGGWLELARVRAHSAPNARVKAAGDLDAADLDRGVELRAVPARSWDAGAGTMKARHETRIVTS